MDRLQGRTAFITGAAQGIGRATAELFAAEGAAVGCADISADKAGAVAEAIVAAGGRALAIACDVRDSAAVKAAVDRAAESFGGLHVVMANAATYTPPETIETLAEADWQAALDVNLTGVFLTCRHALPHLRAGGGGSIILTASQMARVANLRSAAYCATKGAVVQLAKAIALDHAEEGIRVNALSPGGIATDRLKQRFGDLDAAEAQWGPRHPLGRLGRVEEIARAALFLASDESAFMTGSDLLVDGGYAAQ